VCVVDFIAAVSEDSLYTFTRNYDDFDFLIRRMFCLCCYFYHRSYILYRGSQTYVRLHCKSASFYRSVVFCALLSLFFQPHQLLTLIEYGSSSYNPTTIPHGDSVPSELCSRNDIRVGRIEEIHLQWLSEWIRESAVSRLRRQRGNCPVRILDLLRWSTDSVG